jgi:hypothetical protein
VLIVPPRFSVGPSPSPTTSDEDPGDSLDDVWAKIHGMSDHDGVLFPRDAYFVVGSGAAGGEGVLDQVRVSDISAIVFGRETV